MPAAVVYPLHERKGGTAASAFARAVRYVSDPEKSQEGSLVVWRGCEPQTAADTMALSAMLYSMRTGQRLGARGSRSGSVLAYHVILSFPDKSASLGEVLSAGTSFADRLLPSGTPYVLSVHTNTEHPHCHILTGAFTPGGTARLDRELLRPARLHDLVQEVCGTPEASCTEAPAPDPSVRKTAPDPVLEKAMRVRDLTRGVYLAYKSSGSDPQFYARHRSAIEQYRRARRILSSAEHTPVPEPARKRASVLPSLSFPSEAELSPAEIRRSEPER